MTYIMFTHMNMQCYFDVIDDDADDNCGEDEWCYVHACHQGDNSDLNGPHFLTVGVMTLTSTSIKNDQALITYNTGSISRDGPRR